MKTNWGFLTRVGGPNLAYRLYEPDTIKGYAIVVPGYGDHIELYDALQNRLCSEGYANIAVDLRGHGSSGGTRYHAGSFSEYAEDISLAVKKLTEKYGNVSYTLIGHSQGGLAIHYYANIGDNAKRIKGLSMIAPFYDMNDSIKPNFIVRGLAAVANLIYPKLTLTNTGGGMDNLSDDPTWINYLNGDAVYSNGKYTIGWYFASKSAQASVFNGVKLQHDIPIQFLVASNERLANDPATYKMYGLVKNKSAKTEYKIVEGKHKLLWCKQREKALDHIIRWISTL
jgi:alpha-beta hydrolase superfamily lysophospholipase